MGASEVNKMAGQPEKRFNVGLVKATVWKNTSRTGDEFKSVSLNKSYMKNGEWKNTNSLGIQDIDAAISVLEQARDYINGADGSSDEESDEVVIEAEA